MLGFVRSSWLGLSAMAPGGPARGQAGKGYHGAWEELSVKEILRTNDAVLVSAVEALLTGAGIPHVILDRNMSVLEGSLGILPSRIVVDDDFSRSARRLLEEAGLARELRPDVE
jgi:Putative prokaryotic signal transducing protein